MSIQSIWSGFVNFSAAGSASTVIEVPMPPRGILRGYRLVQNDGSPLPQLTAKLYTSDPTNPRDEKPKALFEILSFTHETASNDDTDISYLNKDGTPSLPKRVLYLEITPSGAGEKDYVFSVTVRNF